MNPLVSTKRAGRLLMALAAISSLFLTVGCGSSGNGFVKPNPVGFSDSSLSGTYVFSSSGVDSENGDPLVLAGALVADGKGGISSGGTMDVVDPELTPPVLSGQAISGGSYNIGSDGRGSITLTSSAGGFSFTLDVVLISTSHGLVTEFDGTGTGSGTLDLQTALTGIGQLAGPYAFSLGGEDSDGSPFASAGAFALNSSGATATPGIQDFNDNGVQFTPGNLTVSAALGSGTGPGQMSLSANFGPLAFDFYPIDATHLKLIEVDDSQFLSGDVFTQNGASIPTGQVVFTMGGGGDATGPVATGGYMTSDGAGNFPNGFEDANINGTIPPQAEFSGTAVGAAGVGGRVSVNLSGFVPALKWVIYPFSASSGNGILILETDQAGVTVGAAYAQSATSFAASNYGLNLSGANTNGLGQYEEVDDIAQFDATATATNNMTGALSENDEGNLVPSTTLSGAYTPDSPATGRGSISVTTPNTFLGGLTLEYYVADASTVLFMEGDQDQFSTGTFELQSPPSGGGNARSHIALARPAFLKPAVRARLAARRKK